METISRSKDLLCDRLINNQPPLIDNVLFDELQSLKSCFLNVLDVGPRDTQQCKQVEAGKAVIHGREIAFNPDFARQVIFLSQQLNCSEYYIAELLHGVRSADPNGTDVDIIERAVAKFHERRRDFTMCLVVLFNALVDVAARPIDNRDLVFRLESYVHENLIQSGLPMKVLKQIGSLTDPLRNTDSARCNARTDTIPPGAQAPSLGFDVLNAVYNSLLVALVSMSRAGYLGAAELDATIDWLSQNANHSLTYYMLAAILGSIGNPLLESLQERRRAALVADRAFIQRTSKKLSSSTPWSDTGLRAAISLKWALFLVEARCRDLALENVTGFRGEDLEPMVPEAFEGNAIQFLIGSVIQISGRPLTPSMEYSPLILNGTLTSDPQQQPQSNEREVPSPEFTGILFMIFDDLIRSLVTLAQAELRAIKQRQEDVVLSGRGGRARPSNTPTRADIAALYSFIGILYTCLPPESALQYWGCLPLKGPMTYMEQLECQSGHLPKFLQFVIWSTPVPSQAQQPSADAPLPIALYDMLSGLAHGQQCSELAYNFMARGVGEVISSGASGSDGNPLVSWLYVFEQLDSWVTQGLPPNPPPSQMNQNPVTSRRPPPNAQRIDVTWDEVVLGRALLRFLSTVVTHSLAVPYRAVNVLANLLPMGLPVQLKSAVFDTLAAFSEPGAGLEGLETCRTIWAQLEATEVINVRRHTTTGGALLMRGVEAELKEVESLNHTYPVTLSFLRLLTTLLHTPKRLPLRTRATDAEPVNTIPETLGQPYRTPGIAPFVAYVLDVVLDLQARQYADPEDEYRILELCFCFAEHALASWDLESFVTVAENSQPDRATIASLVIHPGYQVMCRILNDTLVRRKIFEIIRLAPVSDHTRCLIRALRIMHRVLEIQDIFVDVLVPLLPNYDLLNILETVHPRSYFIKLDQALSFDLEHVSSLALCMSFPGKGEPALLAIKILTILTRSLYLPNLPTVIQRSNHSEVFLSCFVSILATESMDDVFAAEEYAEERTGAGAPLSTDTFETYEQAVRLAALELLNRNTKSHCRYPNNLAVFFLYGSLQVGRNAIESPHALGARRTAIHVLLSLVSAGVPRMDDKGTDRESRKPLFQALPGLAERCYQIIYQLCTHPKTSESTVRYLRTTEDFFARQLSAIPNHVPADESADPYIQVHYNDGTRITTSVNNMSSFFRLRSWIFDLAALDIHVLTNKGQYSGVVQMLEILFSSKASRITDDVWDAYLHPFQEVGQTHMLIIDFAHCLVYDWHDSLEVEPVDCMYLSDLNFQSCIREDPFGCEIVDREALLEVLTTRKRTLHASGQIATRAQVDQLGKEIVYILESCVVENHRRQVVHATARGYDAWRRLLDIALTKCFSRIPRDRRENALFEILNVLPPIISSQDILDSTAISLAEVVLSTIIKLREDRRQRKLFESDAIPPERLYAVLRAILQCVLDNDRVELVRGNLYATLVNYFHLIAPATAGELLDGEVELVDGHAPAYGARQPTSLTALETGSLSLMKGIMDRLVAIVSRDATDGTEVWKTTAFMLLDFLLRLSALEKQNVVLTALNRHGILANFVRGLKEADIRLQAVLKPDPEDLNSLYVYEAKMSTFIRMAGTRAGAERLMESRLLSVLGQCDFLDARPEADQAFIDYDAFLPSAVQRYHQLFAPALQLVNEMLTTLGHTHATMAHQACTLDFLSSHGSTIVILLKSETNYMSRAVLDELYLLVSLCSNVLEYVPKTELATPTAAFGAIHSAILNLASKCLCIGHWHNSIQPQTSSEVVALNVLDTGFDNETRFHAQLRQTEQQLHRTVTMYLGAASNFTEPEISLIVSPMIAIPRSQERTNLLGTVPTLGDILESLSELSNELESALSRISGLSAEIENHDHIRVDNIRTVLPDADPYVLDNLEIGQKRTLVSRELKKLRLIKLYQVSLLFSSTEMLLLLLWRHLACYLQGHKHSAHSSLPERHLTVSDPGALKMDAAQKVMPLLQRLESVVNDQGIKNEWQANQFYIEIMASRLRECVA
ncbi:hypothetical protein FISHEDRAFT_67260 [Fistulina hepatica ATCC 64428]|uniref:Nucleoporin Nup186/Nup192/Nup205 n=1 Tax=Fistulina hepatica ATCC 64428 TaxID=1128425 RepID=A0A0D7A541_9AGAR|nr:hypothetical protein FISHEDRAFT_67260 [Fistulina hepatica ATCC 64428]